jgi:hypothetical protein
MRRAMGVPGSRRHIATKWTRGAISNLIWHLAYSGGPAANRYQTAREHVLDTLTGQPRKHTRQRLRRPDGADVVPLSTEVWPPLVSAELAVAARARLAANQEESARNLAHGELEATLLRGGYVYCYACGRTDDDRTLPPCGWRWRHVLVGLSL